MIVCLYARVTKVSECDDHLTFDDNNWKFYRLQSIVSAALHDYCWFERCPNSYIDYIVPKSNRLWNAFPLFRFDIKSLWLIYLIIVFSSYVLIRLEFLVMPDIVFVLLFSIVCAYFFFLLYSLLLIRSMLCAQTGTYKHNISIAIWAPSPATGECGKQIYSYIIYFEINVSFNCNRKLVLFIDKVIYFYLIFFLCFTGFCVVFTADCS